MPDSRTTLAIPRIRRARGFRLYDMQGRRYLDLFRDGALLGHRGAGSVTAMKSALSQGLAASLPVRLGKAARRRALSRFSPVPRGASVRLAGAGPRCGRAGASAGRRRSRCTTRRSTALLAGAQPVVIWRPLLPADDGAARALLPLLPVRVGGAPAPACFAGTVPSTVPRLRHRPRLHPRRRPSRSSQRSSLPRSGEGACLRNPAVEKALDAAPGWARSGPYVRAAVP